MSGTNNGAAEPSSTLSLRLLFPRHVALITDAIDVAHICRIESLIIGNDWIRGIDKAQSVCIIHKVEIELPFTGLSSNEVDRIRHKLDIAAKTDDLVVNVVVDDDQQNAVQKIVFTGYLPNGTRTVFDHRCAHPAQVKAPRYIDDTFPNTLKLPKGTSSWFKQPKQVTTRTS